MSKSALAASLTAPRLPLTRDAHALLAALTPASIAAVLTAALGLHAAERRLSGGTGRTFSDARVLTQKQRTSLAQRERQWREGGR